MAHASPAPALERPIAPAKRARPYLIARRTTDSRRSNASRAL